MTVSLLQHCKDAGQADTYIVEHPEEEEGEETKTKRARETDTKSWIWAERKHHFWEIEKVQLSAVSADANGRFQDINED